MSDMLTIEVTKLGGPEVLKPIRRSIPKPEPGQVLIAQEAIGVNFVDLNHRAGHPYPTVAPFVPGIEAAGRIEAVGEGIDPARIGQLVGYAGSMPGAYAEYAAIDAELVFPIPEGIDVKRAVSVIMQAMTAYYLSHLAHPIKSGETVLIHAAAGGVGGYLVQFAKAQGATVIGTTRSDVKRQNILNLGAEHALKLTDPDFTNNILAVSDGCDVVFDSLGGSYFMPGLRCLKTRGHYVGFGLAAGSVPPFDPAILSGNLGQGLLGGSLNVQWVASRSFIQTAEDRTRISEAVFGMVLNGTITSPPVTSFPLVEAAEAHRRFEAGENTGKFVLIP